MGADLQNFAPSIPADFRKAVQGRIPAPDLSGDRWLKLLPQWIAECAREWKLRAAGPVWHGACAVVVPCRRGSDSVVLKLTWPHAEARLEHVALRTWNGHGAVRLIAADPSRWAMLLEPLHHDRDLTGVNVIEACEIIGDLLSRLGRPAPPLFDPLSSRGEPWTDLCRNGSPLVPRRLTNQAAAMLIDLAHDCDGILIHEDLHFANVLAADREPWLAIDPKPLSGDLQFAVAPLLWNRWDEARSAHNLRMHLRLRLGVACDAAGIDERRTMAWSFVRLVTNALTEARNPSPDMTELSRWIAIAKTMTD